MHRNAGLRGTLVAFALLGATALAAVPALAADDAKSQTPWLGVYTQTLDDELRDAMDLTGDGALVSRVVDGSPAERAGLRKGDVIVRFGGSPIGAADELIQAVRDRAVGDNVTLEVRRGRETRTLTARLDSTPSDWPPQRAEIEREGDAGDRRIIVRERVGGDDAEGDEDGQKTRRIIVKRHGAGGEDLDIEIPDIKELRELKGLKGLEGMPGRHMMFMGSGRGRLGVQVQNLNEQLGDYFGVPGGKGALVMEVVKDSPAEKAGLRAGDVITRVGDKSVEDPSDLIEALRGAEGPVRVTALRKGQSMTFEPTLEKAEKGIWRSDDGRTWSVPPTPRTPRAPRAPRAPRIQVEREREDASQMREELRELREELRRLREELEESKR